MLLKQASIYHWFVPSSLYLGIRLAVWNVYLRLEGKIWDKLLLLIQPEKVNEETISSRKFWVLPLVLTRLLISTWYSPACKSQDLTRTHFNLLCVELSKRRNQVHSNLPKRNAQCFASLDYLLPVSIASTASIAAPSASWVSKLNRCSQSHSCPHCVSVLLFSWFAKRLAESNYFRRQSGLDVFDCSSACRGDKYIENQTTVAQLIGSWVSMHVA